MVGKRFQRWTDVKRQYRKWLDSPCGSIAYTHIQTPGGKSRIAGEQHFTNRSCPNGLSRKRPDDHVGRILEKKLRTKLQDMFEKN